MLAFSSIRTAGPACRRQVTQVLRLGSGSYRSIAVVGRSLPQSHRCCPANSSAGWSASYPVAAFSTSRRLCQNEPPEQSTPEEIERTVREAKQRFGDTLPSDYLTTEEYKLYKRLYGPPLRETTPDDVGIPSHANMGQDVRKGRAEDQLVEQVYSHTTSDQGEEGSQLQKQELEEDKSPAADEGAAQGYGSAPGVPPSLDYINAVARNEREYKALLKLQQEFEVSKQQQLEEKQRLQEEIDQLKEEVAAEEAAAELLLEQELHQRQAAAEEARYTRREKRDSGEEETAAAENQEQEGGEEEDESLSLSKRQKKNVARYHKHTIEGHARTRPATVILPHDTLVYPIAGLLKRADIKHVKRAAIEAFGGPGLPLSPMTAKFHRKGRMDEIGLQANKRRMTEIEADAFLAAFVSPAYAAATYIFTELRKRLGSEWLRGLMARSDGKGPRVLDAGAGGAAMAAWKDVLQAEADLMFDEGLVDPRTPREPPCKSTVVVGSDTLRHRVSRFLHNTTFLPRLPDYLHTESGLSLDGPDTPHQRKSFDVIISSYQLLQIEEGHRRRELLGNLWEMLSPDGGIIIFVEKGHPRGFEAVAEVRSQMLNHYIRSPRGSSAPKSGVDEAATAAATGDGKDDKTAPTEESQQQQQQQQQQQEQAEEIMPSNTRVREPGMVVAPCTTQSGCPMYTKAGVTHGRKDFCHFAQRFVQPPFLHRVRFRTAGNDADVQFSYVAVRRGVVQENMLDEQLATLKAFRGYEDAEVDGDGVEQEPGAFSLPRLVLPPLKRKGHVVMDVCTPEGRIERWTVPRSFSKQAYHDARKSAWGDLWALGARSRYQRQLRLGKDGARLPEEDEEMDPDLDELDEAELGGDDDYDGQMGEEVLDRMTQRSVEASAAAAAAAKGGRGKRRKTFKASATKRQERKKPLGV